METLDFTVTRTVVVSCTVRATAKTEREAERKARRHVEETIGDMPVFLLPDGWRVEDDTFTYERDHSSSA